MFRDRLILSLIGLVVTTTLTTTYLLAGVLNIPLTGGRDRITVEMSQTGGLFEGSGANYRGVRVGTVDEITIGEAGGVLATVTLHSGVEVPRETRAVVRTLSPVGEQYLDFQPEQPDGPFLADGDRIGAESVDFPVLLADAAGQLDSLLANIDEDDLRVVLRELSAGLSDSGDDLESLLVSTDQLVTALDENFPATQDLLNNGKEIGQVLAAQSDNLAGFSKSAKVLTAWLKNFDPTFRRILRDSPENFDTIGKLVSDLDITMPLLLEQLVELTDVLYAHEPHTRALIDSMLFGSQRFASVFRNGSLNINLNFDGQKACTYGTEVRDPQKVERHPLMTEGSCSLTDRVWRGAEHAPPAIDR